MREAAVVHAPAMAVATTVEPATEATTMISAATTSVWPRERQPAGCRQKYCCKPGTPGCA